MSANEEMTRPRVVSDLLMLLPSFSLSPRAPVFPALSLPARSTKLILATFSVPSYPGGREKVEEDEDEDEVMEEEEGEKGKKEMKERERELNHKSKNLTQTAPNDVSIHHT